MNKVERVKAVLNGQTPDKVPAGFWFHYPASFTVEETVKGHLDLFRHTDMDIMKIMQDFMYPIHSQINSASDWYKIKFDGPDSPEFKKQAEVIKRILDGVGGEAMAVQTMFGPFKAASFAFGDDLLMAHAKENPKGCSRRRENHCGSPGRMGKRLHGFRIRWDLFFRTIRRDRTFFGRGMGYDGKAG